MTSSMNHAFTILSRKSSLNRRPPRFAPMLPSRRSMLFFCILCWSPWFILRVFLLLFCFVFCQRGKVCDCVHFYVVRLDSQAFTHFLLKTPSCRIKLLCGSIPRLSIPSRWSTCLFSHKYRMVSRTAAVHQDLKWSSVNFVLVNNALDSSGSFTFPYNL